MKKVITERDIFELEKKGIKVLIKTRNTIITPLAFDRIKSSKFTIIESPESQLSFPDLDKEKFPQKSKIILGSDHTGFKLKNILIKFLSEKNYLIEDAGTYDENPCDYPDFAKKVAMKVASDSSSFGILIDATGIPSAITANKIKGILAATCYNTFSAKSSRSHNNANILVVGSKTLGEESIKEIVSAWLSTGFDGGRHQKRLDKIREIENGKID